MRFLIGLRASLLIAMLMFLITAVVPGGSAATEAAALSSSVWLDQTLEGQDRYADQLIKDTEELQSKIKSLELDPITMVAGAMELLNEAATSKITGEEELYSRTDLVDLAAKNAR